MISRRHLLLGSAAFPAAAVSAHFGLTAAAAFGSKARHVEALSPLGIADDLKNPREIQSENGRLVTELAMEIARFDLPYAAAHLRTYHGEIPGPTLRVSPGDDLEITLRNKMPANTDTGTPVLNEPNQFNSTNLHFHGFHVSPKGNSDNVYLQINPGETFNYVVRMPQDHPAGNYWYHPHRHGSVAVQVASGCGGMMVVRGTLDEVPEIRDAVERVLVFQSPVVDPKSGTADSYDTIWSLDEERYWLINGQFTPRIYIRQGEVQHWRILHAGDEQFLPMTLDGLTLVEIGFDGNPYDKPRETKGITVAPGNRANVLVRGDTVGVFRLRRPAFTQGKTPIPDVDLAEVIVLPADTDKVAGDVKFGRKLPSGALPKNAILADIADAEIVNRRRIELGAKDVKGMYKDIVFTLNGEPFDPARDDIVARLGTAEEWELVNMTPFPHPIHVHVNPFQVVAINGEPQAYKHWQDTIAVPAAGTVTLRTRFTDFDGRYVMHCHILPHEDLGMMLNVHIKA